MGTVTPVNDPPVVFSANFTTAEDTPFGDVYTVTDIDTPLGSISCAVDTLVPSLGSVVSTGTSFVYTPNLNANGLDEFRFVCNDGDLPSNTGTIFIEITPVNDPPVATPSSFSVNENDPPMPFILEGSDPDVLNPLDLATEIDFELVSLPCHWDAHAGQRGGRVDGRPVLDRVV